MLYREINYVFLVLIGFVLNFPANATEARISMLTDTCIACHGEKGVSVGPATPSISGMRESLFIKAMEDMKTGKRPSTVMAIIAKGYTSREIAIMAAYFHKQPTTRYSQSVDEEKARRGKVLYEQYCSGCHKIKGKRKPLSNKVAGQWMPYLRIRLEELRSGRDSTSPVMTSAVKNFLKTNSEESLEDIIHFYGSQK